MKNTQNAFLGHFCTLHIFDEKTKKLNIYFVLNFQGFAICAIGVACKSLNNKQKWKKLPKNVSSYIYINHLKNAIFLKPLC